MIGYLSHFDQNHRRIYSICLLLCTKQDATCILHYADFSKLTNFLNGIELLMLFAAEIPLAFGEPKETVRRLHLPWGKPLKSYGRYTHHRGNQRSATEIEIIIGETTGLSGRLCIPLGKVTKHYGSATRYGQNQSSVNPDDSATDKTRVSLRQNIIND